MATVEVRHTGKAVHTVRGDLGVRGTVVVENDNISIVEVLLPAAYPNVVDLRGVDLGDLLDVLREVEKITSS